MIGLVVALHDFMKDVYPAMDLFMGHVANTSRFDGFDGPLTIGRLHHIMGHKKATPSFLNKVLTFLLTYSMPLSLRRCVGFLPEANMCCMACTIS